MKKLTPRLGLGAVVAISISAMLGSGIFVLPGIAIAQTGPSVWLAYLCSALCILPAAMSKSELATAMPTSGGTYVYLERTFGPLVGTVAGFGLCFSLLLKSAFALVGFGAYLTVLADVPLQPTALTLLAIIVVLNIVGVGKVSSALIVGVLISLTGLSFLVIGSAFSVDLANMEPFFAQGSHGFLSATALVFVSFAGVTKVAAIAEEIKNPEKNLPWGILLSLFLVTGIYCGVNFVLVGNFSPMELANNLKVIHTLAEKIGGPVIGTTAAVIGILTMMSMANAGILAASRFPFAMSRDRLLPSKLGQLSQRFLTPVASILVSGGIVAFCLMTLNIEKIAKYASAFMLLIYIAENVAVILLRETRVQWYKPTYNAPLYPWMQLFGIFTGVLLLIAMGIVPIKAMMVIGIPGVLLFVFYSRKRTLRRGVIGIRGARKDLVEEIPSSVTEEFSEEDFGDASVVVSLFGKERSPEMLIEMGRALADSGRLEVLHLTEIPEQTTLDDIGVEPANVRSLRRRVQAMSETSQEAVVFDPVVTHDIFKTIHDVSQRLHCQWLVQEWGGKTRGAFTIHKPMGWLRNHLSCNLAIYRDAGVRYIRKVMVVLGNNRTDALVVSTADHLALLNAGDVTFIKFFDKRMSQENIDAGLEEVNQVRKSCVSPTNTLVLQGDSETEEMIAASAEFDLLVCGADVDESQWRHFFGSDIDKLIAKATCSVMSVQPGKGEGFRFLW